MQNKKPTNAQIWANNLFVAACYVGLAGGWLFVVVFIIHAVNVWHQMFG